MSALAKLEQRLSALEAEVAKLKESASRVGGAAPKHTWLESVYGSFANDPDYLEAMRLGKAFRDNLKPKARKTKKA